MKIKMNGMKMVEIFEVDKLENNELKDLLKSNGKTWVELYMAGIMDCDDDYEAEEELVYLADQIIENHGTEVLELFEDEIKPTESDEDKLAEQYGLYTTEWLTDPGEDYPAVKKEYIDYDKMEQYEDELHGIALERWYEEVENGVPSYLEDLSEMFLDKLDDNFVGGVNINGADYLMYAI